MAATDHHLTKSLRILNTVLIFVLGLAVIESLFAVFASFGLLILGIVVVVPLKIYGLAGVYGYLAQLVSGEQMVLSFRDFHGNAKRYFRLVAIAQGLIYGVHFLLYALVDAWRIPDSFRYFYPVVGLLFSIVLAYLIIADQCLKSSGLPARRINVSPADAAILLSLFVLECALSWAPIVVPWDNPVASKVFALALRYVSLLEFIYAGCVILNTYNEIPEAHDQPKEIYLVNPCIVGLLGGFGYRLLGAYPPFFVILKALTPRSYRFREFNYVQWEDRFYAGGKLVAISSYTSNSAEAYKIAKEFKRRGSTVVMGGPHVTYLPDEALLFCDSVVIGEAEGVWKELIQDYENGTLKQKYMGEAKEDYYKDVHEELLRSPPHVIKDYLETTRGCKFRCHFCTIPSLSGGRTRRKPIRELVELIEKIKHKYKMITFIDNNIYSDPAYAKELFAALIPLKIKWQTMCTIDIAKNTETLALAKESGCEEFLFGYEIFGGSLEKQQGGKLAMAQNYIRYTDIIKKMGIKIKAHFIFGFDSDRLLSLPGLWKFCRNIWPRWTIISMLTPLPGSRVYHDMLKENRIINLNWRNYAMQSLVVTHPLMNPKVATFLSPFIRTYFMLTTSSGGMFILFMYLACLVDLIYQVVVHW